MPFVFKEAVPRDLEIKLGDETLNLVVRKPNFKVTVKALPILIKVAPLIAGGGLNAIAGSNTADNIELLPELLESMVTVLAGMVIDWKDVKDEKGEAIPYTEERFKSFTDALSFEEITAIVSALVDLFTELREETEATEKN